MASRTLEASISLEMISPSCEYQKSSWVASTHDGNSRELAKYQAFGSMLVECDYEKRSIKL